MNELLREIEEDIRRERTQKLWHSFGKLMVGISIGVILVTIGVVVWQDRQHAHATEQTSQFIKGLDRLNLEDYKGALATFNELSQDPSSSYYGLAMLRKAQAESLSGNKEAASKTYQELAEKGNNGKNAPFAGLAAILAAGSSGELVEPAKDTPFYYTRSEWRAWQLVSEGKKDQAAELFAALYHQDSIPYTQRERVSAALQQLAPEKLAEPAVGESR